MRLVPVRATGAGSAGVRGYVLAPRFDDPPYYVLHVDVGTAPPGLAGELAGRVDQALQDANIEYASKRHSLRLGPVVAAVLPPGYLEQRHRRLAGRYRRGNEQYKHQFLLTGVGADDAFPAHPAVGRPLERPGMEPAPTRTSPGRQPETR